ncbi:MAG TPA: enoyl-CoA hydratase [Gammaproteobacteria bacterium]|nr:enoyl-CoA hydratase [Gammaproteobacteria bacterium]|tara:strand:+ start:193 stop:984 length:792 start_codon:yes stop_codon:yes gene_type:complete
MSYETLKFDLNDQLATITLSRPDAANSLNLKMAEELHQAATHCASNPDIRAVILTAEGKMFCAGGDVVGFSEKGDQMAEHIRGMTTTLHAAVARFYRMDAPLIVAVNGIAAGAGMSIAITGDIVFAAESAKFTMAYSKIGFSPDGSSSYFLPRLIGLRKAKELALLNPMLNAEQACAIGLVTEVVADEDLLTTARSCACQLAEGPTKAHGEIKRLFADSFNNTLETQMEYETRAIAGLAGSTEDAKGGVAAFVKKEKYTFLGR